MAPASRLACVWCSQHTTFICQKGSYGTHAAGLRGARVLQSLSQQLAARWACPRAFHNQFFSA
jgi:hypothetical protein